MRISARFYGLLAGLLLAFLGWFVLSRPLRPDAPKPQPTSLVAPAPEQSADAAITARRMLQAVAEAHSIDKHDLHVTASIGVSVYPDDGLDAETLIKNADTAMYQAKEHGRHGYLFFKPAMNVQTANRGVSALPAPNTRLHKTATNIQQAEMKVTSRTIRNNRPITAPDPSTGASAGRWSPAR